jgi:hypothetical protein
MESLRQHLPLEIMNQLTLANVRLPHEREVGKYLARRKRLAVLLPKIACKLRDGFGSRVELSLELYKDPEIRDQYLTFYVRQEKYEPHFIDRIEVVSREFERQLETVSGHLLITTDFRSPRESDAF